MSAAAGVRDFDGLYKALLSAHQRDALRLLCDAQFGSGAVVSEAPTEQQRPRNRQTDKVLLIEHGDGVATDVYHIEIQVQRTDDFHPRLVSYWAGLALKYSPVEYRIHQVVLWPLGGGFTGRFQRDRAQLDYLSVNVPDDLDPRTLLAGPLAPLALWSQKPPPDLVERVADRIALTGVVEEQLVQIELSMLVGGSLAMQVVEALRGKGMNDVLKRTETGREIARESLEQGLTQGLALGLVNGMRSQLRARYGELDDLDDLARRLAETDYDGNTARIMAGVSLAELRS